MPSLYVYPGTDEPNPRALNHQHALLPIYGPVFMDEIFVNPFGKNIDSELRMRLLNMFKAMNIQDGQVIGYSGGNFDKDRRERVGCGWYPIDFGIWEEVIRALKTGIFTTAAGFISVKHPSIDPNYLDPISSASIYFTTDPPTEPIYR